MPWEEVSVMSQRKEFVKLAQAEGANVRELAGSASAPPPVISGCRGSVAVVRQGWPICRDVLIVRLDARELRLKNWC